MRSRFKWLAIPNTDLTSYSTTTQVDAKDTATLNLAKADATTKDHCGIDCR